MVVGGENRVAVELPGFAGTRVVVDYYCPVGVDAGLRSSTLLHHCSALALVQALLQLETGAGFE